MEKTGLLIRHESLGYDRHRRKYWFLCRRIVVESETENFYYSTKLQLDELIKTFDPTRYEAKLIRNINEQYEEIVRCMQITEELTAIRKESKKSYFDEDNERIRKLNEDKNANEKNDQDEILVQDELLKIEHTDDECSHLNEDVEEYFQIPQNNNFSLTDGDQLDGVVDNLVENDNDICMEMMNKNDDLNDDNEEHELLPSSIRSNGQPTTPQPSDEPKAELKINNLPTSRLKLGDLNVATSQKVKIVNENGNLNLSGSVTQAINLLNKDTSRFKLSIVPSITNTTVSNSNYKLNNSSQIKVINNKITNATTIESNNMLQDYEFGDSLKFVTNMKPTFSSLDSDNLPVNVNCVVKKANEERSRSEKLISTIFENLNKVNVNETTTAIQSIVSNNQITPPLYKLGMESNYRMYENQYSINPMTMNKHQHNQERDRKNILSRRFLITQEFHWKGNLFSSLEFLAKNMANTIIFIENSIPSPFMHHLWPKYREKWLKKLHSAKHVNDFAKCLLELEASMKPVLFVGAWKEGTGYLRLLRETQQEREEHKKEDSSQFKRRTTLNPLTAISLLDETNSIQQNGQQTIRMAHFTKGIKHQVFKQKGEEYRLSGTGGWYWLHKTRRSHSERFKENSHKNSSLEVKLKLKNLLLNNLEDKKRIENILVEEDSIPDADQPWFNNSLHPYLQVFNIETVDVSENLVTRKLYPKEMKKKSKFLDFLLEKRLQSHEESKLSNQQLIKKLEEKIIDMEVEEMKVKEALKQEETDVAVKSLEIMSVDQNDAAEATTVKVENPHNRESIRENINLNERISKILEKSKISSNGEYLVEIDNELIKIPVVDNISSYRFKLKNINKNKKKAEKSENRLPPYANFLMNNKTTIFLFSREITRLIARKGGFRVEIPGFKSDHHKQTVYWPYPCNRPLLKTCWCYKSFTSPNLASLALQIRYFFSCIRWDAINEKPPINSHSYQGGIEPVFTEHLEDCMQITEIIKKRNVGLYSLRSEYLIRKKKIPYKKTVKSSKSNLSNSFSSTPNASRTTSRRSGLRQLRQSIGQLNDSTGADTDSNSGIMDSSGNLGNGAENKNKYQPVEEWIIEERLHLWQIKSFSDRSKRLEMEEIRRKDRIQKMQQQSAIIAASNTSKINNSVSKITPIQVISQQRQNSTINLVNSHRINQPPSAIATINTTASSLTTTTVLNTSVTRPILNMTKVIPRTIIPTNTSSPLQIANIRVINSNISSNLNQTLQLYNGQTVTLIAKPQQNPTITTKIQQINKPMILSASPNSSLKTISTSLTPNSFSNLKINNQSGAILLQKPNISLTTPIQPTSLLSKTITNVQSITKPLEIVHKNEPADQVPQQKSPLEQPASPSSNTLDLNARSRRNRKLPAKLNDSYDLTYHDIGSNMKPRPRPKSIQSILAEKEAEESLNSIAIKASNILSAPTVSIKPDMPVSVPVAVVSDKDLLTKSEQLFEDIENRAKRRRHELLQKHADDLKEMIKYKKASMENDVQESFRLNIDLDEYLELKSRLTSNEFVNKINEMKLEREKQEEEEEARNEAKIKKQKEEQDLFERQQKEAEKQQLDKQVIEKNQPQKLNSKKDEVNNTIINSSNNQNENEIINEMYIHSKRKSKLRPETISPLAVSKENVQQSTEDLKKLSNDVNVIENQNGNNKFEFIAKVNLQEQNRSIEPTKKSVIIEENEVVNKKRKLSVTTNKDASVLDFSECSSGNNSLTTTEQQTRINTNNNKRHKLDSSLSDGEKQLSSKNRKTYCICNSAYDKKRFYIQCDKCANWYHGECVNITPEVASTLETYKCVKCVEENNKLQVKQLHQEPEINGKALKKRTRNKKNTISSDNEKYDKDLFCLCKQPYDEKRFYIGCDKCQDWCHGSCVGILPLEACTLDTYTCPTCLKKEGKEWNLENKINDKNYDFIKNIFYTIQVRLK